VYPAFAVEEAGRVVLTIDQGVAVATLNRPEVRNAVDERIRSEFEAILEQVADDAEIRALRPALERAFASGKPALVNVLTDPSVAYPRRSNLA